MRRGLALLLHAAAAASLAVSVATAVAWARGGWTQRTLHQIAGRWTYHSDGGSYGGRVQLGLVHDWPTPVDAPAGSGPALDAWLGQWSACRFESGRFGFDWGVEDGTTPAGKPAAFGRRLGVTAPFAGLVVGGLVVPAVAWGFLPVRRRGLRTAAAVPPADPRCDRCGYDRRAHGTAQRCPECGARAGEARPSHRRAVGSTLLSLSRASLWLTFVATFQRNGGFAAAYAPAAAMAAVTLAADAAGVRLLTAGDPSAVRARRLVLAAVACLTVGLVYQAVVTLGAGRPFGLMGSPSVEWGGTTALLLTVGWVLSCAGVMDTFLSLARRARRWGDRVLARSCVGAGAAAAVTAAAMLWAAPAAVDQWADFKPFWPVAVAWFATLLWGGLIHLDFAARFLAPERVPK